MHPIPLIPAMLLLCVLAGACDRRRLQPGELERNQAFAEIMKREDRRTLGDDGFFPARLSGSPYPAVREWCAIALGRIGSPRALAWLFPAFSSPYADVRAAAAFAVGEIEDRELRKAELRDADPAAAEQLSALLDDSSLRVRMRAVEALGKSGPPSAAAAIQDRVERFQFRGAAEEREFLGLAITALMRLNQPGSVPLLESLAMQRDPQLQWRAVRALHRMGVPPKTPQWTALLQSPHPDVVAHAARWAGNSRDWAVVDALLPLLPPARPTTRRPNPLSVRVSAVQALGTHPSPKAITAIRGALEAVPVSSGAPDQVNFAVQAVAALGQMGESEAESVLLPLTEAGGPVAQSAIVALGKIRRDRSASFDESTIRRFRTEAGMRALARALGELGSESAAGLLRGLLMRAAEVDADSAYRLAIPTVLEALERAGAPDLQALLPTYLASGDGVIVRSALRVYKPARTEPAPWRPLLSSYMKSGSSWDIETQTALLRALEPWLGAEEVRSFLRRVRSEGPRNVRIAATGLLRKAGATDASQEPGPSESAVTDTTYVILASRRSDRTFAVLETEKGNIQIELYRQDAPLTVANFTMLARSGYYDGLSFMRVVPYFVIQGGDPRNDTEGGPGYTLRCEINLRPFEKGSVGMALAGKDTGGSQFFITLSPQPHLDGGYTCFGRVISGMHVAERIVPGDRILRVSIMEDVTFLDSRRF